MSSSNTESPRPPTALFLRFGAILIIFGVVCAIAMAVFDIGAMYGAATGAIALVIYSVPAALFDWPRISLTEVVQLLCALAAAVVRFVGSLFDW
jgi:uncharacterized membrane protein YeiB